MAGRPAVCLLKSSSSDNPWNGYVENTFLNKYAFIISHNNGIGNYKMRKKCIKKAKTIEDNFYFTGGMLFLINAAIAAALLLCPELRRLVKIPPCLFHLITGYYCPGCGGTRAVRALLHGNILRSLYYHPAVPYGAAIYLYFMATQTIERVSRSRIQVGMRYHDGFLWIAAAIILLNFFVKNILHFVYGFMM